MTASTCPVRPGERLTRTCSRELRADQLESGAVRLSGYATVWEVPYEVNSWSGTFTERMARGTFTRTLSHGADVRLLLNHEGLPLARTRSNTLRVTEDDIGLRVETELDPVNSLVTQIRSAMSRGDLDQMSLAFAPVRSDWNNDGNEVTIREAKLYDVSLVTYPANEATSAGLRARSAPDPMDEVRLWSDRLAANIWS